MTTNHAPRGAHEPTARHNAQEGEQHDQDWRTGLLAKHGRDRSATPLRALALDSPPGLIPPKLADDPLATIPGAPMTSLTGGRPTDVGVLTHRLCQLMAGQHRDLENHQIAARLHRVAGALAAHITNANSRRSLISKSVSAAMRYLTLWDPGPDWDLLSVESPLLQGRTDLVWEHCSFNWVVIDEIKAAATAAGAPSSEWLEQAKRYVRDGSTEYGDDFAGVRLVALHGSAYSRWLAPESPPVAITYQDDLASLAGLRGSKVA